jgi:hypothetical protein
MAAIIFGPVITVQGDPNNPATPPIPPPWVVNGTVQFTPPATRIEAMGYQINAGAVIGFPPPPNVANPAPYNFTLTRTDIPTNGQYLLTVYAWDDDVGNPGAATQFTQVRCINL